MRRIGSVLLAIGLALWLQTPGIAAAQSDVSVHQFFLPGTSTVGYRVHASSSEMHVMLGQGDIRASGGYKAPYSFSHC